MMKRWISLLILLLAMLVATKSYAVDINLINVDMGQDDRQYMANAYGQAYGYTPQQVMPAMYGPPQEVPAILQIAQAAGQVPMTVWMMRRMGMNYGSILSTFALAPAILAGGMGLPSYGMPGAYPNWARWVDPFYIQTARIHFIKKGVWLPPGIAKKYGLWVPPGQAKKMGWGPWGWYGGDSWKGDKHGWKGGPGGWNSGQPGWKYDDGGGKGKQSWKGDDDGPGKGKNNGGGDDAVHGNGKGNGQKSSGQNLAKGNGSSKGKGNSQGGSSANGQGGGKGKGKK